VAAVWTLVPLLVRSEIFVSQICTSLFDFLFYLAGTYDISQWCWLLKTVVLVA